MGTVEIGEVCMKKLVLSGIVLGCLLAGAALQANEPKSGPFLFQGLDIHKSNIYFSVSDKIWRVDRSGGEAVALTDGLGLDQLPVVSPDGAYLAFMRSSSGAGDVYLMDLKTGVVSQLTGHPRRDWPIGFTPDSKKVLFASGRDGRATRLYQVGVDQVFPKAVPLPTGLEGAWSPDGAEIAYVPYGQSHQFRERPHYRGGLNGPLWLHNFESGKTRVLVEGNFNVRYPKWRDDEIYYLSDESGVMNLKVLQMGTGRSRTLTSFKQFGVRAMAVDSTGVVLARDGFLYEVGTVGSPQKLDIRIPLDFSAVRNRVVNGAYSLDSATLIPGGKNVCAVGRGDVFFIDHEKETVTNLTKTSGVVERSAVFSPDASKAAWFSDASGEYQLHVFHMATQKVSVFPVESQAGFYRELRWSPDGKHVCFSGNRLDLFLLNTENGMVELVDQSQDSAQDSFSPQFSPNGRYLAYEKRMPTRLPAVIIYDIKGKKAHEATHGLVHATRPVFDKSGRYLYFISSPNGASSDVNWMVLSAVLNGPLIRRQLNVVVLQKDGKPPVLPGNQGPTLSLDWDEIWDGPIDFDGLERRIAPLDVADHDVGDLLAGSAGVLYPVCREWPGSPSLGQSPSLSLFRLNLRRPGVWESLATGVSEAENELDTLYYKLGDQSYLLTFEQGQPVVEQLRMGILPAPVDTAAEWSQIYKEAWRLMAGYFYDPNFHGKTIDPGSPDEGRALTVGEKVEALNRHFEPWLANLTSRRQLNTLLSRSLGQVGVSHLRVGGGDWGYSRSIPADREMGLLGADFEVDGELYKFAKIYGLTQFDGSGGEDRFGPLTQPGSEVFPGEYLLEVDGVAVGTHRNLYTWFSGKANQALRLRVGPDPSGQNSRVITVVSLSNDGPLRARFLAEKPRQLVDSLSNGLVGYININGYNQDGILDFLRGYYGSMEKRGLVIDQRLNGGGTTSDALIELLMRNPLYYYKFRNGHDLPMPVNPGPVSNVLLIDQWNGSAAETFAFMFKLGGLGGIVGKTTNGAGIGPYGYQPGFCDGGYIQIPNRAAFNPTGEDWGIENMGVAPDLEVEVWPEFWLQDRDIQLEKSVALALEQYKKAGERKKRLPPYPVFP